MDKEYEAERKPIWGHVGKDEAKPPLAQEFEHKTILACEPVQAAAPTTAALTTAPPTDAPLTPASTGQKSKSNPLDG